MKAKKKAAFKSSEKYLGDYSIAKLEFEKTGTALREFQGAKFKQLNELEKHERVNRALLELIQKAAKRSGFWLIPALDYIDKIHREKILDHYTFSSFELWLNQFSGLSCNDNYCVRAALVGKYVPREKYQILFPVGMNKTYPGPHFVTAHNPPDLDTTVASFWGWMDAFGARVSEGTHIWNVPNGEPSQIEIEMLFHDIFGKSVFHHLARTRTTLAISSLDLLSQKGVVKKNIEESSLSIDHERTQNAVILVDEEGYYLGDWRNFDVEGVRQIIMLLGSCLRWYENNLHLHLISLFAKEDLAAADLGEFGKEMFEMRLRDCAPAKEFSEKQKNQVHDYLTKVLGVRKGLESTIEEFAHAMKALSLFDFQEFVDLLAALKKSSLFNRSGKLIESRPRIFHALEKIIKGLDKAIHCVRSYVDRLDIALKIKTEVFGYPVHYVGVRAEIEEVRSKINNYPYLTVTASDKQNKLVPLGIVHSSDLHKSVLGTVTLRDFCNREETKIPAYLEVISVIDHHKSVFSTNAPPVINITDAQSSNSIVAEMAFEINDAFSSGGMTIKEIEAQIKLVEKDLSTSTSKRIMRRLLKRHLAITHSEPFYIDPQREFIEYLHFLYAILEDTDLLTKVSLRDVECVAELLNRLKSLMFKKEVEVISFDDLDRNGNFVQLAAKKILQNHDMYSLYRKIYLSKENAVEQHIRAAAHGKPDVFFADTKEQNGCCRVGQAKMFAKNYPAFRSHALKIRQLWYEEACNFYRERKEYDLHLQMVTTLAGAEDLFADTVGKYDHKDELWIWIPFTESSIEHLTSFLNAFKALPQIVSNDLEVEFTGDNAKEFEQLFRESFLPIPRKTLPKSAPGRQPMAILRFNAGTINSRKAMISPYLPRLI